MMGLSVVASVIVAATAIMILISVKSDVATSSTTSTHPPPSTDSLPAVVQSAMPPETIGTTERTNPPARAVPPATDEADRVRALQQLRQSLDERWPMYAMGDTVALRRTDGLVHRGQLAGVRDGYTLLVDGDRRERVRLDVLDGASRLRVDPDWREQRVAQRLEQLRNRDDR